MKRIQFILLPALLLIYFPYILGQNVADNNSITGSWLGKLSTGAIQLRVIFNFSVIGKDSLVATLDSPDQGAKNIKMGQVKVTGQSLKVSAPAIMGEYNGTIKSDTTIEGTWKQAGNTMPLNLLKLWPWSQ